MQQNSMMIGTEGHFDTQDNMIRNEAIPLQEDERSGGGGLLGRLSQRSRDGYRAASQNDLEVNLPTDYQAQTGTNNFGRAGRGAIEVDQNQLRRQQSKESSPNKAKKGPTNLSQRDGSSGIKSNVSGSHNKSKARIRPGTASQANTSTVKKRNIDGVTPDDQVDFQQDIEMKNMLSRPMSGNRKQDSFMSDDKGDAPSIKDYQIQQATESHNIYDEYYTETDPDDVSEETYQVESQESSESLDLSEEEAEFDFNQPIRVYDARFKIPAQSNIGQLMSAKNSAELNKGQTNKEYRNMVKALERYKKFVSTTVIMLMALAMLYNLGVYVLMIKDLQTEKYYIARTKQNITVHVDFEDIQISEILYFLYKNESAEAADASDDLNTYIEAHVDDLCEHDGVYLNKDPTQMKSIKRNISSFFMLLSEAYILLLMVIAMIFAVIVIPQRMKEHHVPMLMRQADENMFHVMMRIRGMVFLCYMTVSGCLTHLNNYYTDRCLHTGHFVDHGFSEMDVHVTDYYQYCMVSLIWFISVPTGFFLIMAFFRDATRYAMIPCMVTSIVFMFFAFILSLVAMFNSMFNGKNWYVRSAHYANFFVYFYLALFNGIYRCKYAKRDLLRSETEEIDQ